MSGLHPENRRQKERLLSAQPWLCMERAKCYTDVYRETEGENPSIRAAKALARTFREMTIEIYPDELLIGNRSSHYIAPPFAPEKGDFNYVFKHLFPRLERYGYRISPEHRRALFEEILPYWEGRCVRDVKVERFREKCMGSRLNLGLREMRRKIVAFGAADLLGLVFGGESADGRSVEERSRGGHPAGGGECGRGYAADGGAIRRILETVRMIGALKGGAQDNVKGRGRCIDTQAHIVVGHGNVLRYGFRGIGEKARRRRETAATLAQRNFLTGVEMVCDAVREFSGRFSSLARRRAMDEEDASRREELIRIAEICDKVPWNPPETFHEAIQSMWFTQNAVIISYGAGSGITPGRIDQLLYPYYRKDRLANRISDEQVLRLLEEFIIKINNNVVIWPNIAGVHLNHLGSDIENITIGGVDRDGKDACNELSNLLVDALRNTRLATSASFRISVETPEDFLEKVVALHRDTNGPAFFNDEIAVETLMNDGYSLEDARDYCIVGCVEPNGSGDTFGATGGSKIYFPTVLDLVFNRGRTTFFGNRDTQDTGDPLEFESFDEFTGAFYRQMEYLVSCVAEATGIRDDIWAETFHNPLISCTIDGCIEAAMDMTEGGARYNFGAVGGGGLGTAVDSLAAIKKFVYDEGTVGMKDLAAALRSNFRGRERLRQILTGGPKFGNDDDYADSIAVELADRFCDLVSARKRRRNGHYKASFISYGLNVYEGALEPATPDGRKAGQPLSNSVSPSNGAERRGPTAVLMSLAKLDHRKIGFGNSLNMKFPRYLLDTENGAGSIKVLVKSYFEMGGYHVQFNMIGVDTLRDAQKHPERYRDLIVRVSGYSAYFTALGKKIQDDIIERTEFR